MLKPISATVTLNSGVQIPRIGFGTYQIPNGEPVATAVRQALETGYRHIDCAAAYKNEDGVGEGLRQSGLKRDDFFLTSKVWVTDMGYDDTLRACENSLKQLGVEYLDLYLIHWPKPNSRECFRALEKLCEQKLIRSVGVSNFRPHHFEEMILGEGLVPAINQVEYHPYLPQDETQQYCKKLGISITAHSPFMEGEMFKVPLLAEIAAKHQKSVAQVTLRWALQRNVIIIPKSVTPARMKENFEIFNFELDDDDMKAIAGLENGRRSAPDPDNMPF